jgi:hypothetical protein
MIWESFYWKSDLLKHAGVLKKRIRQKRWPDASLARCEQTIMLGFYSIRKLTESAKLTDHVSKMNVSIRSYRATGQTVHLLNKHRLDELYDLDNAKRRSVSLPYLSSQIVHSYVFSLLFDEDNQLAGILVTSDRDRSKELLEVPIQKIIEVFEKVGKDEANVAVTFRFDDKKGDWIYKFAKD